MKSFMSTPLLITIARNSLRGGVWGGGDATNFLSSSLNLLPAVAVSCRLRHPEADLAAARPGQFLAIEGELPLRPVPAPEAALHKVHDKQILQLFNFRETEAFGFGNGFLKWNLFLDIGMPALEEPAAQVGIGRLEMHDQVNSARSFESPVDQV